MTSSKVLPFRSARKRSDGNVAAMFGDREMRILLVEDDAVDERLFLWVAQRVGIELGQITVAHSVVEAAERIAAEDFDLYVLDFWLGAETSLGLIEHLGSTDDRKPVLVLSNLSEDELVQVGPPGRELAVLSKADLGPDRLRAALDKLTLPKATLTRRALKELTTLPLGPDTADWRKVLDQIEDLKALSQKISTFIAMADGHLSSDEAEDAHGFVADAARQLPDLDSALGELESLVRRRATKPSAEG